MKKYALWIASVYVLLLLIPLPLFITADREPPEGSSSGGTSVQSTQSGERTGASAPPTEAQTTAPGGQAEEKFLVLSSSNGEIMQLSARELMIGSTAAEMYPTYHAEAMKAQAVAVYSYYYVVRQRERASPDPELKGADFADTTGGFPIYYTDAQLRERWGDNYEAYYKKISGAVDAVIGKRILHGGQPILAIYHSISSGVTEDATLVWGGDYPYLKPVQSPGDRLSPNYQSEAVFTPEALHEKLSGASGELKLEGDASGWIDGEMKKSESGMVTGIKIGGAEFTGRQLRDTLGLRSSCFDAKWSGEKFVFTVYGYGHNVGMSQYGADYLARQGSKWDEILKYYYTGVTVE